MMFFEMIETSYVIHDVQFGMIVQKSFGDMLVYFELVFWEQPLDRHKEQYSQRLGIFKEYGSRRSGNFMKWTD